MRVGRKGSCTLYEAVISRHRIGMRSCGSVIQRSEDPRGPALLNEIADDLVIEVFDFRPLDPLTDIFLLLSLECQLDENLLQLFVDIVNAKLLERIFL
jgi:hypothetical protein